MGTCDEGDSCEGTCNSDLTADTQNCETAPCSPYILAASVEKFATCNRIESVAECQQAAVALLDAGDLSECTAGDYTEDTSCPVKEVLR